MSHHFSTWAKPAYCLKLFTNSISTLCMLAVWLVYTSNSWKLPLVSYPLQLKAQSWMKNKDIFRVSYITSQSRRGVTRMLLNYCWLSSKISVLASEVTPIVIEATKVLGYISLCSSVNSFATPQSYVWTFTRTFTGKFRGTKNKIRTFRLHCFCTIL